MSRFRFVADHRHTYGVKRLCEVLQIARSSFYAWLDGQPRRAQRATVDAELAERIRVVHQRDPTQGVPRIAAELNVFRRLAGWAIAEHMRTELVADALTAARDTRGSLAGAVFHSDHSLSSTPRRTSRSSARAWG